MFRFLLILCLVHAPLLAVTAGDKSPLELTDLRVTIDLSEDTAAASVTCKATLRNPGEDQHTASLSLPREVIPEKQREGFALKVAGGSRQSASVAPFHWDVIFDPGQSVEVVWSYTLKPINLPHTHPQGEREVRIALGHMRGFAGVPKTVNCTVSSPGIPPELFGRETGDTSAIEITNDENVEDYAFRWLAEPWQAKRDALLKARENTAETQRTHLNRSYTETLVLLADLYALKNEYEPLAEVCETLGTLETEAGKTITHCGPWAEWRRHVPWQLLWVEALTRAGKDAKKAAIAAKTHMAAVWPEYLKASGKPQPFEYFDRNKYGNYWDYDWGRTRKLYAAALELLGESNAAQAVKDTE